MKDNNLTGDPMYQSFSKYKQIRENHELDQKINLLCESIVKSGKSFDDWWLEKGLPTVIENSYSNENELLLELMGEMGQAIGQAGQNAWQGMKNFGRGAKAGWQGGPSIPSWQPSGGMNPNTPQGDPAQQGATMGDPAQAAPELMSQVQSTQQQFVQKLKDFKNSAVQSKDQNSYQAIDQLIQALSGAARQSYAMGQGQSPQQSQPQQGATSGPGLSASGGNVGSSAQQTLAAAANAQRQGIGYMSQQ